MLSLSHTTSFFCSRSVKHHIAQPFGLGFAHGRAALKTTGSGTSMGYWLMKTEPGEWGWEHQEQNGGVSQWDGVRNALAQIHLRSMRPGDHAFFYHSGKGPAVVGVVEVVKAAYPDTSDDTGKFSMVDVRALAAFPQPVPLSVIKSDGAMRDWILLRQSRLSVLPVSPDVWRRVCALGELSPPLCRNEDDDDALAAIKPQRKRRGEEENAELKESSKQKPSVNGPSDHEEQSIQSAELKTYRRSSRKRTDTVEPPVVKTYKSRRVKKQLPGDDITLNPKP